MTTVIIGAGLAGLTCAKMLWAAGDRDWLILEASDRVGGRVKTDTVEGFRLDQGFQVLFTAYPAVQRHLDLAALNLCDYAPGAVLVKDGTAYPLGDPLRQPQTLLSSITNPLLRLSDKLNVLRLRVAAQRKTTAQIFQQPDRSTLTFLQQWGFSELAIASFFRPFYGGIFLDSALETSANLFWFYFKMLASGRIVTPALGMGELSQQLAQGLPPNQIRTDDPVKALVLNGDQITAIERANGEHLPVSRVVCATDAASARRLLPDSCHSLLPPQARPVSCHYFASERPLYPEPVLYLNSNPNSPDLPAQAGSTQRINQIMQLSNVSPHLAPAGQHLLSVTVLADDTSPAAIQACEQQLRQWFRDCPPLRHLRSYRIPFAQFQQLPGFSAQAPTPLTPLTNLFLSGEYLYQSSIEGAIASGEKTALELLK